MQMDRLLAPTRPYNAVLRPSDGKVPDNIAYVMCTGSRDETVGNPLCSKICCMYSVKQNQLIMGALPLADVTVYYIDVRSVGKGYDEFYQQAKDMGANFVKGRVSGITETDEGNLVLRYEDIENGGALAEAEHDLVVLAVGVQPNAEAQAPLRRRRPGARRLLLRRRGRRRPGPRPHQPARRVRRRLGRRRQGHPRLHPPRGRRGRPGRRSPGARESEGAGMSGRKIGVYVCQCGGNISDYVDVDKVVEAVEHDPDVVVARSAMFTCSDATQQEIVQDAHEKGLDALVVASCSPKLHTVTFRDVAKRAGMNPFQYTQVNVREQCSWTHTDDHEGATEKAVRLVRAGINRTRLTEPLEPIVVETTPQSLVVGGGIAGLRAALGLAEIGLSVFLVEKEPQLGGWVAGFGDMYPHGRNGADLIARLEEAVRAHPAITVFTNAEVMSKSGSFGNYQATIAVHGERLETITVDVGSIVVATGFDTYEPAAGEFGYGIDGVVTLPEFKKMVDESAGPLAVQRPAGQDHRLHLLRRQPPGRGRGRRPHLLLALLLHGRRPRGARGGRQGRPGAAPVPPLPRHAHLRQVRAALEPSRARRARSTCACPTTNLRLWRSSPRAASRSPRRTCSPAARRSPSRPTSSCSSPAWCRAKTASWSSVLKLPVGNDGFFNEIHPKLRPVETIVDGVLICGACQSPKNSAESVASGLAAVTQSGAMLKRGFAELDPMVAHRRRRRLHVVRQVPRGLPLRRHRSRSRRTASRSPASSRPPARAAAPACRCVPPRRSTCRATPTPRSKP